MNYTKKGLIRVGKYIFIIIVALVSLFTAFTAIIADDIKIGDDCIDLKKDGLRYPTYCFSCLGLKKLIIEDEFSIRYKCIGVSFRQMFE